MAIPFLSDIKDLIGIGGAGAQIWNLFRDQKNPALDAMMQENQERQRLRNMALNPNDPQFLNMVALEEEAQRGDFVKSMNEALRRQNRAYARGSVTTRPERQDEFFNTIRQRLTSGPQARQRVQGRLLSAAGTPDYGNAVGTYENRNIFDTMRTDAAIKAAMQGASGLLDMWTKRNSGPGTPVWRDPDTDQYKVWEG